jgi:ubiquinone/menaquinone biosynthesis C-methylase UbiE
MDAARASVQRLFDTLAGTYDQVGVDFFRPIAAGLVDVLGPTHGERVLVMGCGRGAEVVPLAEGVGGSGRVLALDLSPAMVEECRKVVAQAGLDNVEVRQGDAQEPALDEPPFDLVASSLVLFFLPHPQAALEAWLPLLRPGGRLGLATFRGSDPVLEMALEVFDPYLPPDLIDARTTGAQGPFASDAGMTGLLRAAGFVDVQSVGGTVSPVFRDVEHWYEFSMSLGMRRYWESVPPKALPGVRDEVFAQVAQLATSDGTIQVPFGVRYSLGRRPR